MRVDFVDYSAWSDVEGFCVLVTSWCAPVVIFTSLYNGCDSLDDFRMNLDVVQQWPSHLFLNCSDVKESAHWQDITNQRVSL